MLDSTAPYWILMLLPQLFDRVLPLGYDAAMLAVAEIHLSDDKLIQRDFLLRRRYLARDKFLIQ